MVGIFQVNQTSICLIHMRTKGEGGLLNMLNPSSDLIVDRSKRCFFKDYFLLICFMFVFVMLSWLFLLCCLGCFCYAVLAVSCSLVITCWNRG